LLTKQGKLLVELELSNLVRKQLDDLKNDIKREQKQ
jgi:hypothetical protein